MDLPISEITYHSRRRDNNQGYGSYLPFKTKQYEQPSGSYLPFKTKQYEQPSYKGISDGKSFYNNVRVIEAPSFSYMGVNTSSNFEAKRQEKTYTQRMEQNYQIQIQAQRQKVKTLSQHLKASIQSNNEIQQNCNALKRRYDQKQTQHINQMSILKADLIILEKQHYQERCYNQKKDQAIQQVREKLQKAEQTISKTQNSYKMLNQQLQNQINAVEHLKKQLNDRKTQQQKIDKLRQSLSEQLRTKDYQINDLNQKIEALNKSIAEYETIIPRQQSGIQSLQKQKKTIQSSLQKALRENKSFSLQILNLKGRIDQLNCQIKQICRNSEHLFEQIKENKLQKEILNKKLDQKQVQMHEQDKKLESLMSNFQSYDHRYDELRISHDIIEEQYRLVSQKHSKLQEKSVEIQTHNRELITEIESLQEQIKQLKTLCINQESKQSELLQIIKGLDDEIIRMGIRQQQSKQVLTRAYTDQRQHQQALNYMKPTRDLQKRVRTETYDYELSNTQKIGHSQVQRSQIVPYSQYLSFKPSHPYQSTNYRSLDKNRQKRLYTTSDELQASNPYHRKRLNTVNQRSYSSQLPKDRRSQSFYVERCKNQNDSHTMLQKQKMLKDHKIFMNDLQRPRYQLQTNKNPFCTTKTQKFNKKSSAVNLCLDRNGKYSDLFNERQNKISDSLNEQKGMLMNKLDRMKMWTKQSVSQNCTQREPLEQISSEFNYLRNKQTSIQAVIQQKSKGILQQRKNLYNFNLNSQMIQKNILKLQKNTTHQSKSLFNDKPYISLRSGAQNLSSLSPIPFDRPLEMNDKQNGMVNQVNQPCRKILYRNQ